MIRLRIFYGFLVVILLSIAGVVGISYILLKRKAEQDSHKELRQTIEMLTSSLNYAVSQTDVTPNNVANVLSRKILEISDITQKDIVIYSLDGKFLLDNGNKNAIIAPQMPKNLLTKLIQNKKRLDITEFSPKQGGNITSSYMLLQNDVLEPVAVVYFPFYHNDIAYWETFYSYILMMVFAVLVVILLGVWLSWRISNSLTQNIRNISNEITKINLNEHLMPIIYHSDDEFTPLINAYNKTLRLLYEQKELLAFREKEEAWREMAKQVAHEVKNPLTPMKLLVQNFERKFDREDPSIDDKVRKLCKDLIAQIDLITKVANAFSEFTKLPERKDETINVNEEIISLVRLFDEHNEIETQLPKEPLLMNFDRSFFQRIMTNLILNAQQAKDEARALAIRIIAEKLNKKIHLTIADNGVGIPRDRLDKIFEFNFTTKSSGTGLGLTMVKRVIKEYNGEISIESQEKKGTRVRVVLPINIENKEKNRN